MTWSLTVGVGGAGRVDLDSRVVVSVDLSPLLVAKDNSQVLVVCDVLRDCNQQATRLLYQTTT